jgi:hypothetical protein
MAQEVLVRVLLQTYLGRFQSDWSRGRPYNLPTSGPIDGNTSVVIYGDPLELSGGNHYQCRIGPLLVNATYLMPESSVQFGAAGILCITDAIPAGRHRVEVTLNAQQFTNSSVDGATASRFFVAYDPPNLTDTFPRSGPHQLSFALRLHGHQLAHGSDYVWFGCSD